MRVNTKVRWTCVTWKVSTSLGLAYLLLKNQPCCLLFANYCLYYCPPRASGFVFFSPYFPTSQTLHLFTPVLNLYTTELWNTPKIVAIHNCLWRLIRHGFIYSTPEHHWWGGCDHRWRWVSLFFMAGSYTYNYLKTPSHSASQAEPRGASLPQGSLMRTPTFLY